MSIVNAQKFIRQGMEDCDLRAQVNSASDYQELTACLDQQGLEFTYAEFDEAFHHLLTLCQTQEQAEYLKEFKLWWDLTLSTVAPADATVVEPA